MKDFKKNNFFLFLSIFVLILLFLIYFFNWTIDPYDLHDGPRIKKVNWKKPEIDNNVEMHKIFKLAGLNIRTLLLGSSRVGEGINPNQEVFLDMGKIYNFGVPSADPSAMLRYLNFAIETQPNLSNVLMGIDLHSFLTPRFRGTSFRVKGNIELTFFKNILFYLSFDTLVKSIKTIIKKYFDDEVAIYTNEGLRIRKKGLRKGHFEQWMKENGKRWFKYSVNRKNVKIKYKEFESLEKIKTLCKKRNIKLIIFLTPAHASLIETFYIAKLNSLIEEVLRNLIKKEGIWSFYGHNAFTTESVEKARYYEDFTHFTVELGDRIIKRLLSNQEKRYSRNFGVWLNKESINNFLKEDLARRDKWSKENKETVDFLKELQTN